MRTIYFEGEKLHILDQRKLPSEEVYIVTSDYLVVCEAIKTLAVRGAPAIGVAAAYAVYLASKAINNDVEFLNELFKAGDVIKSARPTAVNLSWAVDKQLESINNIHDRKNAEKKLLETADEILREDIEMNKKIGDYGSSLFKEKINVLTHCNAGALATGDYGTALGVIRSAYRDGKINMIYADETRPLLQGARLTVYELMKDDIPVTLITDNMAAWHMKQGKIDCIVVGADRIVANGDTANKIGTYNLGILAKFHNIPLYIAAPYSTFDFNLKSGSEIIIEERNPDEVRKFAGTYSAPSDCLVSNPAFDVTPAELITGIITERGIISPVNEENIRKLMYEC